jgi:predicted RNA-binding protein (virulence factor B family)
LDEQVMGYDHYKAIKTSSLSSVMEDPAVVNLRDKLPNLLIYEDATKGQMMVSTNEVISCIEQIREKKQQQSGEQVPITIDRGKQQSVISSPGDLQTFPPKPDYPL